MSVVYSHNPITEWDVSIEKFILYKSFVCAWYRVGLPSIEIEINEGFKTDFASIPRMARSIISVFGRHIQAAITHDKTYESVIIMPNGKPMTKLEADTLFLEGMHSLRVNWPRRKIMYRAVRIGGTGRWKD